MKHEKKNPKQNKRRRRNPRNFERNVDQQAAFAFIGQPVLEWMDSGMFRLFELKKIRASGG